MVIINVYNGPGEARCPVHVDIADMVRQAKDVTLLGYVHTLWGKRDLTVRAAHWGHALGSSLTRVEPLHVPLSLACAGRPAGYNEPVLDEQWGASAAADAAHCRPPMVLVPPATSCMCMLL